MSLTKESLLLLAGVRLKEAKILFENQCYSGAYYVAGYNVKLNLKAKISENFLKNSIPDKKFVNDIHTHDLSKLLWLSGVKPKFDTECKANQALKLNWDIITRWSEISRYKTFDKEDAYSLINAIDNQENGLNQWLHKI
jgi:HEPN domain-containing protein